MTKERLAEIDSNLQRMAAKNSAEITAWTYAVELLAEVRRIQALFTEDDAGLVEKLALTHQAILRKQLEMPDIHHADVQKARSLAAHIRSARGES